MSKCIITNKPTSNFSSDSEGIMYSVRINNLTYNLSFENKDNWDAFLTDERKHALHAWLWNKDWPFDEGVNISQELIERSLRQVPYPKDFYSRLDYFMLKFFQNDGDKYIEKTFFSKDYLASFSKSEDEFFRIIHAAKDNNWLEEIQKRKTTSEKIYHLRLLKAGIKKGRELFNSQGLNLLGNRNRPLANKKIFVVYVEEDKEWGEKVNQLMMDRGATIHSKGSGINKGDNHYLLNHKGTIQSCDFVLCIKSANADKSRVWGDVIATLSNQEELFLGNNQFFYVLFIDDSPFEEYQHLQFRMNHLIDIRIRPRLENLFLFVTGHIAKIAASSAQPVSTGKVIPSNTPIIKFHNTIFDFLLNWSEQTQEENRYFYLRTREDERFQKGYWFPGDENYLAVSFWTGGDALNKTPNIYVDINLKKGISVFVIAKDSENKKKYFEQRIVSQLQGYEPQGKKKDYWKKILSNSITEDYLQVISSFIENDKVIIDNVLRTTLERANDPDIYLLEDEFSSKFGFISDEQFFQLKSKVDAQRKNLQIDSQFLKTESLPYSLAGIKIEKFHGIEKSDLESLPSFTKWIFLTGENGFGKTLILRALALGLTNYDESRDYSREGSNIQVSFYHKGKLEENSSVNAYGKGFTNINDHFIAYGPIRLNVQASSSENQENRNSSNIYNLFNGDGLLKNITTLLKDGYLKKDNSFNNVKEAIIKVLDGRINDITIEDSVVFFHEVIPESDKVNKTTWDQLATGFKGLINIIGDIIFRFSKNFPDMAYKDYEGIIIIDELENHLHPIFQKKLPLLLSSIFPKIQFITSIHSPIPLLGALKESVIVRVNRGSDGIFMERIVIDNIEELTPNILLTSPIFGFSSIISDNLGDKGKLRTDLGWDEMVVSKNLDKELLELYNERKNKID